MAFVATLQREARTAERHAVHLEGTLRDPTWQPADVVVKDLSVAGFQALTPTALEIGTAVSIGLHGLGCRRATVVRTEPGACGFRFDVRLSEAELQTAVAAVVTAPILFPASGRDELLGEASSLEVEHGSRRLGVAVIAAATIICWGAILAARLLIG